MIPPNRPNLILEPAAACLLFVLSGCVTTETIKLGPLPSDAAPRPAKVIEAWDALDKSQRVVGRVELVRVATREASETFYVVRFANGQHAGWIDRFGRAWREEPFRDGLVLVTTDTMAEDLRRLLELPRAPKLRPAQGSGD